MEVSPSRILFGGLVAFTLAASGAGCELAASVDRDKIDEDAGGSAGAGGNPPIDAGFDTTPPPDAPPEAAQDVQSEVQPDVEQDVQSDVQQDVQPDVEPDVQPDVVPDVQPDVTPDVQPDVTPDTGDASTDFTHPDAECQLGGGAFGEVSATFTGSVAGGVTMSTAFATAENVPAATLPDKVTLTMCTGSGGLLAIQLFLDAASPLPTSYAVDAACGHDFSGGPCAILQVGVPTSGTIYASGDASWAGNGSFTSVTYVTGTVSASFSATNLVDVATPGPTVWVSGGTLTTVPWPL